MSEFDFMSALQQHSPSPNTHRAYYRWIDRYLVEFATLKPMQGQARLRRMAALNIGTLQRHVTERKLKSWLDRLAEEKFGRQAIDQARASVVTLAELMYEAKHLDEVRFNAIRATPVPPVEHKLTPERLLTVEQLGALLQSSQGMATSENQHHRNVVVTQLLCTMALRREELARLKWGDIALHKGKVRLQVGGHWLDVPRNVLASVDRWRGCFAGNLAPPAPESPLLRRIWRGGRIAKQGLSPDGVWLLIHDSAQKAELGHVTPDDLRRSVISHMVGAGASLEDMHRLLRHRTLTITERFLAKLIREQDDTD